MAKGFADTDALCRELVAEARKKIFRPVYLLMGDEPFYPDMVCDAVIRNALDDSERDFNQSIYYGADTTADTVITTARRYPINRWIPPYWSSVCTELLQTSASRCINPYPR